MKSELIQQGDVLFFRVDAIPAGMKEKKPIIPGMTTFAEGETTGHHHSCVTDGVELYEDAAGVLWCHVEKDAVVTHQEHKPVTLSPGNYRIGIVREYDPFENEIRSVRD